MNLLPRVTNRNIQKIEALLNLGFSIRQIAQKLDRAPSSVSRELKRNQNYQCETAQKRYERAKTKCGAKTKLNSETKKVIQEKLNKTWSLEQIVGRYFKEHSPLKQFVVGSIPAS